MRFLHRILRTIPVLLIIALFTYSACADEFWVWDENEDETDSIVHESSNDAVPSYWLDELNRGVKDINIALMNAGSSKSSFLFYTDTHWNFSSQRSPALLKYLHNHTGMNKTIFGGDIVWDESDEYDDMAYLWEWRSQIKDLPNHHSVVGNHDDGNTVNRRFDEDFVYGYLLAPEETPDIVRGDQGLYYYIDSPSEKTRYLYLDTAYLPILYYPDQVHFLLDSLMTTPDGWHIVVVGHMWYNPDYDREDEPIFDLTYEAKLVLEVLDAYNQRKSGIARSYISLNDFTVSKIPYDFSQCNAQVEFCIGGHTHRDYDGSSPCGIPVILVETDSYNVRSGLNADSGSINEASVNGIIADYDARLVTIVRIGRGESRTVPLQ